MFHRAPVDVALDPRRNRFAVWARAHDRLAPEVWPHLTPKFTIPPGATIFTIGSCFARNIEEYLERLGYDVPVRRFHNSPSAMVRGVEGQVLNKYTPAAIYQEVAWACRLYDRNEEVTADSIAEFLHHCSESEVIDTNINDFTTTIMSEAVARRRDIFELYKSIFSASCVVITLGQIEAWRNKKTNVYIQNAPSSRLFSEQSGDYEFCLLSYGESLKFVEETISLISDRNKDVRFLLTTSPVAMNRTFTDVDVIVAYGHAKAQLRTVCAELYYKYDSVDYFPSFESAVLTKSWAGWKEDKLHVTDEFVGQIVERLAETYLAAADPAPRLYAQSYRAEKAGDLPLAIELAREAADLEPAAAEIYIHHAKLLIQQTDYLEAERRLRQALEREPDCAEALAMMAEAMVQTRSDRDAVTYAWRAVSSEPRHAGYRAQLAALLAQLNEFEEAEAQIRQAIAIMPRFGRFHLALSDILDKSGRLAEAVAEARMAVQVWPDVASARIAYAGLLTRADDFEEAEKQQRRAIDLGATHAAALWQLSVILSKLDKRSEAVAAAEAAVLAAPENHQLTAYLESLRRGG